VSSFVTAPSTQDDGSPLVIPGSGKKSKSWRAKLYVIFVGRRGKQGAAEGSRERIVLKGLQRSGRCFPLADSHAEVGAIVRRFRDPSAALCLHRDDKRLQQLSWGRLAGSLISLPSMLPTRGFEGGSACQNIDLRCNWEPAFWTWRSYLFLSAPCRATRTRQSRNFCREVWPLKHHKALENAFVATFFDGTTLAVSPLVRQPVKNTMSKTLWISGMLSSVAFGVIAGTIGALISSPRPVLLQPHTPLSLSSGPLTLKPSTPILLFQNGDAHASVKVDRNGLIVLNFTTKTGHNQIALGVLGDSSLQVGVFNSSGQARGGLVVPMQDSARVQSLQLDTAGLADDARPI